MKNVGTFLIIFINIFLVSHILGIYPFAIYLYKAIKMC